MGLCVEEDLAELKTKEEQDELKVNILGYIYASV